MPKIIETVLGASKAYRRRDACNGLAIHEYLMPCETCQTERWVYRRYILEGRCKLCIRCSTRKNALESCNSPEGKLKRCKGKDSHFYTRGFTIKDGYRILSLTLDDPFRAMADRNGRIREHRLVMAKHLGRLLERWEIVHHKNRNRSDNKIKNLVLLTVRVHIIVTRMEQEIIRLQVENERLKCQLQREENEKGKKCVTQTELPKG